MYQYPDPEVRDAYAVTARHVRAEQLRQRRAATRTNELRHALLRPFTAFVAPEYAYSIDDRAVAINVDLGAWLEMQGAETLGRCMFDAAFRADCIGQYIEARVRAETERVNWHDELIADDECAASNEADRQREERIFEAGGL
jgi:hypothetical protein